MKQERWNKIILIVMTIILVCFEVYSWGVDSHYKWDFLFLIGLLWAVYLIRNKIRLHSFHYFLFSFFLLLHGIGIFETYSLSYLGLEFDLYVHGYFGVVSALMLYRTYKIVGPYKGWFMYVAIIAIVLGFSAFHELFEYGGAVLVGKGEGVLFIGAGDLDEWDTQKDMRNNLVGALIGLGLYWIYEKFNKKK